MGLLSFMNPSVVQVISDITQIAMVLCLCIVAISSVVDFIEGRKDFFVIKLLYVLIIAPSLFVK